MGFVGQIGPGSPSVLLRDLDPPPALHPSLHQWTVEPEPVQPQYLDLQSIKPSKYGQQA